ncbi:MAG: metal ABC transporter ATP-binding protein [Armatimonadota bacterium]
MNEPTISLTDVSIKLQDRVVVSDVTFQAREGQAVAIIGPNGAGKTTLIRAMLGLIPSQGSIIINGDVVQMGHPPADVAYVPQKLEFDRSVPMTVRELFKAFVPRHSASEMQVALANLGVDNLSGSMISRLSGGQLQRVIIAMNLMLKPKVLFLDEPSTGIDAAGETHLYLLLRQLCSQNKTSVVMVSHDLSIVSKYTDHVVCINNRMLCCAHPEQALSENNLHELFGHDTVRYHHAREAEQE